MCSRELPTGNPFARPNPGETIDIESANQSRVSRRRTLVPEFPAGFVEIDLGKKGVVQVFQRWQKMEATIGSAT